VRGGGRFAKHFDVVKVAAAHHHGVGVRQSGVLESAWQLFILHADAVAGGELGAGLRLQATMEEGELCGLIWLAALSVAHQELTGTDRPHKVCLEGGWVTHVVAAPLLRGFGEATALLFSLEEGHSSVAKAHHHHTALHLPVEADCVLLRELALEGGRERRWRGDKCGEKGGYVGVCVCV
jgi:hypothetical protein